MGDKLAIFKGKKTVRIFTIMKYSIIILLVFIISGCGNNLHVQKPIVISNIEWKFDTNEDENLITHTSIYLIINDHAIAIDSGLNVVKIDKKEWRNYKIPNNALIACGGWWAGVGSYYYVKKEKGNLTIYRGYADEELPVEESYKYQIIKTITSSDLK